MSKNATNLEQLRDKPDDELRNDLAETRDALFRLQLGQYTNQVTSTAEITKKPAETRMGTGKGGVEGWVAVVRPGRVIFEVEGCTLEIAKEAFHRAHHKLPVKTALVTREGAL